MNVTSENLGFLFNTSCLTKGCISILQQYNFYFIDKFARGYLGSENLTSFLQEFDDLSFVKNCLLEWNYETYSNILSCESKSSKILYQNISKPDAWPLDLIDNVLNDSYSFSAFNNQVELWILDTGINWKHQEFESNQVIDVDETYTIRNITHPHGTGTACAAGGLNYGTSKHIPIYNFPVCRFGGSCGSSDIDKGLQMVLLNTLENSKVGKRTVINMSFGSSFGSDPMKSQLGLYYNALFENITSHGGIIIVSAGNSNQDACTWLYSYSPFVISVGSLDRNYNKSTFSNYGNCIDIWFFGSNVPVAYSVTDNTTVQYKSGTSFSGPYVAGLIANVLNENITFTKEEILNVLFSKRNQFIFPDYHCGLEKFKCCQSKVANTRLDKYCKSFSVYECPRQCYIQSCESGFFL